MLSTQYRVLRYDLLWDQCSVLRTRYRPAHTECCVLGTGYWVLGTGYWVLGIGYWVLGTGYRLMGISRSPPWPRSHTVFTVPRFRDRACIRSAFRLPFATRAQSATARY